MVNRVILVGHLTRDAEPLAGARGPVTRMRLATNNYFRDASGERQEETEYHTVVAFQRLAEICSLYCLRGRRVYIEGRLRTREYDGTDGLRRHSTEVIADTMRLLDRRDHENGSANGLHPNGHGGEVPTGDLSEPAPEDDVRAPALAGAGAGS